MMRCKLMDIITFCKSIKIAKAKKVRQLRIIAYAAEKNDITKKGGKFAICGNKN